MNAIETINGEFTAKVFSMGGVFAAGYGYEDASGFNLVRPLKWFKTLAGAKRYAYRAASLLPL